MSSAQQTGVRGAANLNMDDLFDINDPRYDDFWRSLLQPDRAESTLFSSQEPSNDGPLDFDEVPVFPDSLSTGQSLNDHEATQERVEASAGSASLMHALDNTPSGMHAPADAFHHFVQPEPMILHLPIAAPQDASCHR